MYREFIWEVRGTLCGQSRGRSQCIGQGTPATTMGGLLACNPPPPRLWICVSELPHPMGEEARCVYTTSSPSSPLACCGGFEVGGKRGKRRPSGQEAPEGDGIVGTRSGPGEGRWTGHGCLLL